VLFRSSTPAVATGASGATVTVWNADDPNAAEYSIQCRAIDASGAASGIQRQLAIEPFPDVVSTAALANGNFVIAWDSDLTGSVIRTALVRPDCTTVVAATP